MLRPAPTVFFFIIFVLFPSTFIRCIITISYCFIHILLLVLLIMQIGELRSGSPKLLELNDFMRQLHKKGLLDVLSFCEVKCLFNMSNYVLFVTHCYVYRDY